MNAPAFPEKVEMPLVVLQQAFVALQAAGRIRPDIVGHTKDDVQAIVRSECAAVVLKAHVQRAINEAAVTA